MSSATDVSDTMTPDEVADFSSLPCEVLISICCRLVPQNGFAGPLRAWQDVVHLSATSTLAHAAMVEAMQESFPVASDTSPGVLSALLHSLHLGGGSTKWRVVRPLRAVRPRTQFSVPMQAPPRLSGGSLCVLAPCRLCLFGGRDSASGDTSKATHLLTLRDQVAIWDQMICEEHPAARCYHTAVMWDGAPRARTESPPMIVFGGAGSGDSGHENLLQDVWSANGSGLLAASAATPTSLSWLQLQPDGTPPAARSSHICTSWPERHALVVHGGLSNEGYTCKRRRMPTPPLALPVAWSPVA